MSKPTVFPEPINRRAERHIPDDVIVAAFLMFPADTLRSIAERVGLSDRQLRTRVQSSAFQAKLAQQRANTFSDAATFAASQAVSALTAMQSVMNDATATPKERILAAKMLIDSGVKLHEATVVVPQLAILQSQLDSLREPEPVDPDEPETAHPGEPGMHELTAAKNTNPPPVCEPKPITLGEPNTADPSAPMTTAQRLAQLPAGFKLSDDVKRKLEDIRSKAGGGSWSEN